MMYTERDTPGLIDYTLNMCEFKIGWVWIFEINDVSQNWDERCVSKLLGLKMCLKIIRIKEASQNLD